MIGDVHGCYDELVSLLRLCKFNILNPKCRSNPSLFFVGDLIAKGPQSQQVLSLIRSLPKETVKCVLGNHEHRVLQYAQHLNRIPQPSSTSLIPPFSTMQPIRIGVESEHLELAKKLSIDDLLFLQGLPLYIRIPEYSSVVVHAGLDPMIQLVEDQLPSTLLLSRQILSDGTVSADLVPTGTAWAKLWKGPETIIFGHDARNGIQVEEFAIGLDSGCCYGKQLTAYSFPEREFIQVKALAEYQKTSK